MITLQEQWKEDLEVLTILPDERNTFHLNPQLCSVDFTVVMKDMYLLIHPVLLGSCDIFLEWHVYRYMRTGYAHIQPLIKFPLIVAVDKGGLFNAVLGEIRASEARSGIVGPHGNTFASLDTAPVVIVPEAVLPKALEVKVENLCARRARERWENDTCST